MALPSKLKNLNLFNEGNNYIGLVTSFTPPKLSRKTENFRGGGMNGSAAVDLGMDDDALKVEWTAGGFERQIFEQWGIAKVDGVMLRFAQAFQRDDTGEVDAIEIIIRGRHQEIDSGTAKPGDDTEVKISTACTYYKLSINGQVLIEIDTVNFIEVVNGDDRLMDQRLAIGL